MFKRDKEGPFVSYPIVYSTASNTTSHEIVYLVMLQSSSTGFSCNFFWSSGSTTNYIIPGSADWPHGVFKVNEWNHITVLRNCPVGHYIYYFRNGTYFTGFTSSSIQPLPSNFGQYSKLHLGAFEYPDYYGGYLSTNDANVYLSEIKIYNDNLSFTQITEEYKKAYDIVTGTQTQKSLKKLLETKSSSLDLDEDIRENYYQKSSTAGRDVYGPNQGRNGTDSITFNGWLKGS
jgi:hypothetical protein